MKKNVIITLVLLCVFSIVGTTSSALAFPGPPPPPPPGFDPSKPPDFGKIEQVVKDIMSKLLSDGKITQAEADKADSYFKQNKPDLKAYDASKITSDLKNLGISDKNAQTIADVMNPSKLSIDLSKAPDFGKVEQAVKDGMSKLLSDGKITQAEADKADNYFKQNKPDSKTYDSSKVVSNLKNLGISDKDAQMIADAMDPSELLSK